MKITTAMCLIASLSLSLQAKAFTYRDYKTAVAGNKDALAYITGYYLGMQFGLQLGNAEFIKRGLRPMYCEPNQLKINGKLLMALLDDTLQKSHNILTDDTIIDGFIYIALEDTFPCDKEAK